MQKAMPYSKCQFVIPGCHLKNTQWAAPPKIYPIHWSCIPKWEHPLTLAILLLVLQLLGKFHPKIFTRYLGMVTFTCSSIISFIRSPRRLVHSFNQCLLRANSVRLHKAWPAKWHSYPRWGRVERDHKMSRAGCLIREDIMWVPC